MTERVEILGLVGPSAVGKGYSKEAIKTNFPGIFEEPIVVTTRSKRPTDNKDRRAGVPINEFFSMVDSGVVLFAHQPFGENSDWYGFLKNGFEVNKILLTEVHIDNVQSFKIKFGKRVRLIALIAKKDYLEKNIKDRATESEETIRIRLSVAIEEVEKIKRFYKDGLIDHLITVNMENRAELDRIVVDLTVKILNEKI